LPVKLSFEHCIKFADSKNVESTQRKHPKKAKKYHKLSRNTVDINLNKKPNINYCGQQLVKKKE